MKTPLEILLEKAKNGELISPPRFSFSDELSPGRLIGPREDNLIYPPPKFYLGDTGIEVEFEASYKDLYANPPPCDNQTGGVVDVSQDARIHSEDLVEHVEPWFLDPVFQIVEIGPFGKPEHLIMDCIFTDTWEDNEGHIQVRETPVTDFNFVVTSGGLPIYFYAREGYWLGSEMIRRGATA